MSTPPEKYIQSLSRGTVGLFLGDRCLGSDNAVSTLVFGFVEGLVGFLEKEVGSNLDRGL